MSPPKLSIVVVSYNTCDLLRRCLNSIVAQMDSSSTEVIVVDNNSKDGSAAMVSAEFPLVNLIANTINQGFSKACNQGWRAGTGAYVLFSNGDIFFPPTTIRSLLSEMEAAPDVGILSPELVGEGNNLQQMTWGWDITFFGEMKQKTFNPRNVVRYPLIRKIVSYLQRAPRNVPLVAGACFIARSEMLEKTKGFDEDFELYLEDSDLCLRCRQSGYNVRFFPGIKVFHALGASGKKSPRKIELVYRQSQLYFYRKHRPGIEYFLVRIYLALKFLTDKRIWTDTFFRRWLVDVLLVRKRVQLCDDWS